MYKSMGQSPFTSPVLLAFEGEQAEFFSAPYGILTQALRLFSPGGGGAVARHHEKN
ncbi:MAG TPA: hypothetical protein PKZ37_06675 [Gallionellaceae bacterium]|jgi:hypothetical protein|nr:hypothetical protein [Gallionellaceae bacterium]